MTFLQNNADLIERLTRAQNSPAHIHVDIMTFAGFCDTREELETYVIRAEEKAAAKAA